MCVKCSLVKSVFFRFIFQTHCFLGRLYFFLVIASFRKLACGPHLVLGPSVAQRQGLSTELSINLMSQAKAAAGAVLLSSVISNCSHNGNKPLKNKNFKVSWMRRVFYSSTTVCFHHFCSAESNPVCSANKSLLSYINCFGDFCHLLRR